MTGASGDGDPTRDGDRAAAGPATPAPAATELDEQQLLLDAQAFVADEAGLLEGLGSVLDQLAAAEAEEAEGFDTEAMWARVQAQLWPDAG